MASAATTTDASVIVIPQVADAFQGAIDMSLTNNSAATKLLAIFVLCLPSYTYAKTVKVTTPRVFTSVSPDGWVSGKAVSKNTRLSFVAPKGTPSAECTVMAADLPAMRGQTQVALNQLSIEPPNIAEFAAYLSNQYNNVKILSAGSTIISGYPAHYYNLQYSVGTQNGEVWSRGFLASMATTPGITWSVGCSALGRSLKEATAGYSYWQLEMNLFPSNIKIK